MPFSSMGLVAPETTKARDRHSPSPLDFVNSSKVENSAQGGNAQAPDLVPAMLLAARQHAVAGLRSDGASSHAELSLSRLYGARAGILALATGAVR